jgi:hypothetical protein
MKTALLFIGIGLLGLIGCDNCNKLDCVTAFDTFQFKYVSKRNEDLVGGTTKKYNVDDIKVYSTTAENRKIDAHIYVYNLSTPDLSVVEVYLNSNEERFFLEMKGTITDTLDFRFNEHHSKCCGTITRIQAIRLNGVESILPLEHPLTIVEKD